MLREKEKDGPGAKEKPTGMRGGYHFQNPKWKKRGGEHFTEKENIKTGPPKKNQNYQRN